MQPSAAGHERIRIRDHCGAQTRETPLHGRLELFRVQGRNSPHATFLRPESKMNRVTSGPLRVGAPVGRPRPVVCCRHPRRTILRGHGHNVVRLRIQRERLGARHRVEVLLDLEAGRTRLPDDCQHPVAVRAERLPLWRD
jgi:hypothetical protein